MALNWLETDSFEQAKNEIVRILATIEPITEKFEVNDEHHKALRLERTDFPEPALLFFILWKMLGLKKYGPWEKMRIAVDFMFEGTAFALRFQKFGVYLHYWNDQNEGDLAAQQFLQRARGAISYLSKHIQPFAEQQVNSGNVTVSNQFVRLNNAYWHFRDCAANLFDDDSAEALFTKHVEGFYSSVAMADFYFSRLEHLFVLCLPFVGFSTDEGCLREFVYASWKVKFTQLLKPESDPQAAGILAKLDAVKERFRNTLVHGGIEKNGASLFFHLEGVGAVRIPPPGVGYGVRLNLETIASPLVPEAFSSIIGIFDETDEYLRSSDLEFGYIFAESGLPVAFDLRSRKKYEAAMTDHDTFQEFLEHEGWRHDRSINMDF